MYIHGMRLTSLLSTLATFLASATAISAQAPAGPPQLPPVPTTRVLAIGHIVTGTDRSKLGPVMQKEVPDTVRLYLSGKIDQWYVRKDQNGVVFILNCTTVEEAHTLLEALPLGVAGIMKFDLIPLGPLSPLNVLLRDATATAAK